MVESIDKIRLVDGNQCELLTLAPGDFPKILLDCYLVEGEIFPVLLRVFHAGDISHRAAINMLSEQKIDKLIANESFFYSDIAERALANNRKFVDVLAEKLSSYYRLFDFDTLLNYVKMCSNVEVIIYSGLFRHMIVGYLGPLVSIKCFIRLTKEEYTIGFDNSKTITSEPDSVRYNNFKQQIESVKLKIANIQSKYPDFMTTNPWLEFIKGIK